MKLSKLDQDIHELQNRDSLSPIATWKLSKRLRKIKLLSHSSNNAKISKREGVNVDVDNYILYLAPHTLSGINLCPYASQGCIKACLNTAGRGRFTSVQKSRMRKALYFKHYRQQFLNHLSDEIERYTSKAFTNKHIPAFRLNGTSDINFISLIRKHPRANFYDYTKNYSLIGKLLPRNYHVTFSASEENHRYVSRALKARMNVSVIFEQRPDVYLGVKVIDGDAHDLRFLDERGGVVVGLSAKGDAMYDASGFVRRIGMVDATAIGVSESRMRESLTSIHAYLND